MGKCAGKNKSTPEISLPNQSPAILIRCMQGTPFHSSPPSAVVRKTPLNSVLTSITSSP
ncbi:hypothetical protein PQB85_gp36 [Erwinia phage Midgardsormr38]|uniref:Uncharacterized protein n=1 Tax=Erwinia phage Midgardsormr38 TaxID=2663326 RepID=A0A5Q2F9Z3_9CAUD|nr:hypothetical protein PQB85_gp36 [Erwinia phage Midgardsormr38]QGF21993.1 hypothetical protein [Erwinia phage Midgardsormr38]